MTEIRFSFLHDPLSEAETGVCLGALRHIVDRGVTSSTPAAPDEATLRAIDSFESVSDVDISITLPLDQVQATAEAISLLHTHEAKLEKKKMKGTLDPEQKIVLSRLKKRLLPEPDPPSPQPKVSKSK